MARSAAAPVFTHAMELGIDDWLRGINRFWLVAPPSEWIVDEPIYDTFYLNGQPDPATLYGRLVQSMDAPRPWWKDVPQELRDIVLEAAAELGD